MNKEYLKIIIYRIISSLLILFLVVSFVFIIIHTSPGNPTQKYLSPKLSPKLMESISESYNLDGNVFEQYLAFLTNAFAGDFGVSYNYREPVSKVIYSALKFTILFATLSFTLQMILSFLLVYLVIQYGSRRLKTFLSHANLTVYSIPIFISSLFLIYIFSYQLNILPSSGLKSINSHELNFLQQLWDYSSHLLLPIIASSLVGTPIFYKYLLDDVKNNLSKMFVKNFEIIGIPKKQILFKHVFPNSINSVITVAGVEFGILLSGSVITETIFSLPGMGRLTMNAVITRDYPLIIGTVLTSAIIIMLINLFADLLRVVIDKRLFRGLIS